MLLTRAPAGIAIFYNFLFCSVCFGQGVSHTSFCCMEWEKTMECTYFSNSVAGTLLHLLRIKWSEYSGGKSGSAGLYPIPSCAGLRFDPVSYTHLTLPTNR